MQNLTATLSKVRNMFDPTAQRQILRADPLKQTSKTAIWYLSKQLPFCGTISTRHRVGGFSHTAKHSDIEASDPCSRCQIAGDSWDHRQPDGATSSLMVISHSRDLCISVGSAVQRPTLRVTINYFYGHTIIFFNRHLVFSQMRCHLSIICSQGNDKAMIALAVVAFFPSLQSLFG